MQLPTGMNSNRDHNRPWVFLPWVGSGVLIFHRMNGKKIRGWMSGFMQSFFSFILFLHKNIFIWSKGGSYCLPMAPTLQAEEDRRGALFSCRYHSNDDNIFHQKAPSVPGMCTTEDTQIPLLAHVVVFLHTSVAPQVGHGKCRRTLDFTVYHP